MDYEARRTLPRRAAFVFLVLLLISTAGGRRVRAEGKVKWTVLFYLCGSDLESVSGMATKNLVEMTEVTLPLGVRTDEVEFVIETGGCKKWQAEKELGLTISTESLGRYRFKPATEEGGRAEFILLEELPLSSMGETETLEEFISWGTAQFPAEKYVLFFWDHGGGGKTGLMSDELYDNDILLLSEMEAGLAAADTHFDLIVMDACLMASLETVQAIEAYASYFVGAETLIPGEGGNVGEWLRELYINPDCDGKAAGRFFCDKSQKKYAELDQGQESKLTVLSLVDLSKVGEVSECFEMLFARVVDAYKNSPENMESYSLALDKAVNFGLHEDYMVDLGSLFEQPEILLPDALSLRNRMINALTEAVIYCVKGIGKSGAYGLSFCYGGWLSEEDIKVYVKNCRSQSYLAFLDAFYDWGAGDELYVNQEKLEPLAVESIYAVQLLATSFYSLPALQIVDTEHRQYLGRRTRVKLFRETKDGRLTELFSEFAQMVWEDGIRFLVPPLTERHPTLLGEPVDYEVVSQEEEKYLCNIPVSFLEKNYYLRFYWFKGTEEREDQFEFLGLWEDYDESIDMPSRNVQGFSQLAGKSFTLLYPIYGKNYREAGETLTGVKGMEITLEPLPPGTYYLEYTFSNLFGRQYTMPLLKTVWDGESFYTNEEDMYVFLNQEG